MQHVATARPRNNRFRASHPGGREVCTDAAPLGTVRFHLRRAVWESVFPNQQTRFGGVKATDHSLETAFPSWRRADFSYPLFRGAFSDYPLRTQSVNSHSCSGEYVTPYPRKFTWTFLRERSYLEKRMPVGITGCPGVDKSAQKACLPGSI